MPDLHWIKPGEQAADDFLRHSFIARRLHKYQERNDPTKPEAVSHLSPYLHFGHLAAQRAILLAKAEKDAGRNRKAADSFIEEILVRKELSDNFCEYQEKYDSLEGAPNWAQETLEKHRTDERQYVYSLEQLEQAQTHDELWNAAQREMVYLGKMHGYMRMYWAKKILEWSPRPEDALQRAIYLNDRYELDGRDPNGFVGCMWSIAGVHDQVRFHLPLPSLSTLPLMLTINGSKLDAPGLDGALHLRKGALHELQRLQAQVQRRWLRDTRERRSETSAQG